MFSLNGVDTVFSETVQIYKTADGQLLFETLVNGQNNDELVYFNSSKLTPQQVVFENLNHDFPNVICYELASSNKLNAYISGKGDTIRF